MIDEFAEHGVDIERVGVVALFDAIDNGDVDSVRRLVGGGVSTESVKPGNFSAPAMIWTIYARQPEIAIALIELGADINATDSRQDTPIIKAAQYQFVEVVTELLERDANVGAINRFGVDALTRCCWFRKFADR